MGVGLEEGLNGSSVVVYGQLFVVLKPASVKLKVYDIETNFRKTIEELLLPEQTLQNLCCGCL